MDKYLNNLMLQFKNATNTEHVDVNSQEFIEEFSVWLSDMKKVGDEYTQFLDYLKFSFNDFHCAEVGKGDYDSVVKSYQTTIITPCIESFSGISKDRFLSGDMQVLSGNPMLVSIGKRGFAREIPSEVVGTYMMQNPLSYGAVSNWDILHNSRRSGIIVGAYGSIYDKDIEQKIKILEKLKLKLNNSNLIEGYTTFRDNYFYVVGTEKPHVKIKVKRK